MPRRQTDRIIPTRGYVATQNAFIDGAILDGINMMFRGGGLWESAKGFGSSGSAGGAIAVLLNVASTHGGMTGNGSIVQAFASGVYVFAGSGQGFVGGASIGTAGSSVTINANGNVVNAGLARPGAPTIDVGTAAGHNNGAGSIAVTAIRSSTGGESTISPPSNTVSPTSKAVRITALSGMPAGADRVGIYGSKTGLPGGAWQRLYDATLPLTFPYTIQIPGDPIPGWLNGQLGDLAPLDYDPPPACAFVLVINSVVVAVGCYGGAGLSPSYPNKPEAYPARWTVFIPNGGSVTACKSTGIEGSVLVATNSSMNLVRSSGTTENPIQIIQIWPTTGVQSGNQFCVAEEMIYAFLGGRGAVRSSLGSDLGEDSSVFSLDVQEAFAENGFTASNVVVAYDPKNDAVWYMSGSIGFPYMRATGAWSTKQTLPVSIRSAVTVNGQMLISDSSGNFFTPEIGSGTNAHLVTWFQSGGIFNLPKSIVSIGAMGSGNWSLDVLDNPDNLSSVVSGGSGIAVAPPFSGMEQINLIDTYGFAVKASCTLGNAQKFRGVEFQYVPHGVRA